MAWLSGPAGLTPHGFCLLWDPGLIWTYAVADIGIGLAYFTIPVALAIIAQRRRDLVFRPIFWLFATFILLCGTTHFLDVLTLWVPAYWTQAVVKALTGVASVVTAIAVWRLLPQALALPSPAQLADAVAALRMSEERLHQAQKMEAVGQLTGGIAHDFNNMLQGISGCLELMERSILKGRVEETSRYVATARRSVERAAALTHRMLAFARRQALQPRPVEPDALVRGIEELIRRTVGPEVEIQISLGDGVWTVECDPNQLENTLLNLAINARDAMATGGMLTISSADRSLTKADLLDQDEAAPGAYVEISVADTGTGMTPDILARAFEPFFTTKPTGQGTGLGLSQVFGFVKQSGGFVRLESAAGHGTTVRIYLPRHQPGEAENDQSQAGVQAMAEDGSVSAKAIRGTVLVVEDEADVRDMITNVLRDLGCTVLEAQDGPAGLRVVQSRRNLDLLVTDVGLPGLNGRQLADAARSIRSNLPVLLITGYAGKALEDMELAPGMQVMPKPFALDALAACVSGIMMRLPQDGPPG